MYSAVNTFCIFLFFYAIVEAAPADFKLVSDVSLILSDSCLETPSGETGNQFIFAPAPETPNNANDLNDLDFYLKESYSLCQEIQKNHSDWLIHYTSIILPIEKQIHISPVRHCELSMEQNTQLYILTQLYIFANYFRSLERDDAYPDDVKTGLSKLKYSLYQAICKLRNNLQQSVTDIEMYVSKDQKGSWISLNVNSNALRRAFVMAELNIFSQIYKSFTFNSTSNATKTILSTSTCG